MSFICAKKYPVCAKLSYNTWTRVKKDRGTRLGSFLHAQSVASSLFVSSVGNASSDVSNASKALDSTSETTTIGTDAFVSRNLKALTLQLWYSKRHSGRAAFPPSVLPIPVAAISLQSRQNVIRMSHKANCSRWNWDISFIPIQGYQCPINLSLISTSKMLSLARRNEICHCSWILNGT